MIAKGNLHAHGAKLAAYLTTSCDDERAELFELRGFAATSIRDAFLDVQMQAAATRSSKPFFHAYVRAPEGEALTDQLWQTFADRLEKRLGFEGQPRAVAFHRETETGERHMHIAWSRIDLDTMTMIDPGLFKNKMKQLCRQFEAEFGLTLVTNERGAAEKTRSANRPEFEQSRRLGSDLTAIRNQIRDCWQSADTGPAFAAALGEHGLILARGDRRDFVVVDQLGGDHALSKRITGATAAETRARLADLPRADLPSVADAKAMQRETQSDPRPAQGKTPMNDSPDTAPDDDARFIEQRERQVRDAATLADAERSQAEMHSARRYREQMERDAEDAKRQDKERQEKDTARAAAGDIADPHSRYAQALGAVWNARDPYGSLANAAVAEYGSFHKQQDALRREAAAEKDPDKRRLIDLRREIEGADYLAITSTRLAGMSRAITMSDNAGARRDDELAKQYAALAGEKREQRTELQRELRQRDNAENVRRFADLRHEVERGGLGSAAQQGAAAEQRERPPRYRSPAEIALEKAAGRHAPAPRSRDQGRDAEARAQQTEQTKQREGLKPDQPTETAPPTKEAREISAAEKALRSAAGAEYRDQAPGATPGQGRPRGGRGGGGRGR